MVGNVITSNVVIAELPTGADVVAGAAVVNTSPTNLNVNASTARTIINWDQFSIGAGNSANFNLPGSNAAILNRVTGTDLSAINGALNSNGHVYLVNPNGIMLGNSGVVNTNGFTASVFDIGNTDFMNGGPLRFSGDSNAPIVNHGLISTGAEGAHLIANQITNNGTIESVGGNITMSGGGEVTLSNGVTYVQPSMGTLASGISPTASLIQNTGTIRATGAATSGGEVYLVNPNGKILHDGTIAAHNVASDETSTGGHVQLEASDITLADGSIIDATGTNGGGEVLVGGDWQGTGEMHQATTVMMESGATIDASATQQGDGGKIVLWSDIFDDDSVTTVMGTLIARAGDLIGGDLIDGLVGNGGKIETSGHDLRIDGARVDAGSILGAAGLWLLDPDNYTIDATAAANIGTALSTTDVTVTTASGVAFGGTTVAGSGDILVDSSITKSGGSGTTTLTLQADRSVVMQPGASINGASGAPLNVVLWANNDESLDGGVTLRSVNTQGGHLYVGGGAASTTWNGLTVPDAAASSYDVAVAPVTFAGGVITSGGDVLIWAGSEGTGAINLAGASSINSGSGDITLIADDVTGTSLAITSTGHFTYKPNGNAWNASGSVFNYDGTISGDTFAGPSSDDVDWLTINDYSSLGGLTLGKSGISTALRVQDDITVNGPIELFGDQVILDSGVELTTTGGADADVILASEGRVNLNGDINSSGNVSVTSGQDIYVQNSMTTTGADTDISLLAKRDIYSTGATSITTAGGDVLLASDIDATAGGNIEFYNGLTINTSGGDITFGGGDTSGSGYAQGATSATAEGIRIQGGWSMNSSGGDIALRGKSFLGTTNSGWGAWGVGTYGGDTTINSGTGTIEIDGVSQSSGSGTFNRGVAFVGTSVTLQSASTSNEAIVIRGDASAAGAGGTVGVYLDASANNIYATGAGGGILIDGKHGTGNIAEIVLDNTVELLANGGDIQLLGTREGGRLWLGSNADVWLGSKAGSPIETSTSDLTIQADEYGFSGNRPNIATTGEFTWLSTADSFGQNVSTSWFSHNADASQTISGLTIGKPTNTTNVNMDIGDRNSTSAALTVDGAVTVYGGMVNVSNDLTSTDTGDIFIQAATAANSSIEINGQIRKTGGDNSTLTLKAAGRVRTNEEITATNSGGMNVVLWSDYDGGGQGGVSIFNDITTNGGSVWAGGSDETTPGSSTWNGLTVGNGDSVGQNGYNHNALGLRGNLSTSGGDVLLWAGDGYSAGVDGVDLNGNRTIDSGAGDITLIADDVTAGTLTINSTGRFTHTPNSNTWQAGAVFDFVGSVSSNTFTGSGDADWLRIANYDSLGGLTLGKTGTTNSIYVYDTIDINGGIELYGADLTVDSGAVLDSTGGGSTADIVLHGTGAVTVPEAIISGGGIDIQGDTVSLGDSLQYNGDVSIVSQNGDLIFDHDLEKYGTEDSSTLLKSNRHIVLNSGADLTTTDGTQDVKFWADSDDSGDGINMISSATVATNGGSLTIGNGSTATIGGVETKVGGDVYINGTAAQTIDTGGGEINIQGETIVANTNGVTIDSDGGDITFGGVLDSGNQYTYVDGPDGQANSWSWSRNDAKNGTAGGSALGDSYLVTITSRLENALAGIAAGYRGAWIGAHRDTSTPFDWKWADGPEAGQHFFTEVDAGGGSAVSGGYANFGPGEPNGGPSVSGETVGQFFGDEGLWNDLSSSTEFLGSQDTVYSVLGYVRETNLTPTAVTIDAGSTGTVTFSGGVGGGKALASLDVTSGGVTVNGKSLITTGAQNYDSALSAINTGALNVQGTTLTTEGNIHFEGSQVTLGSNLVANNASDVLLRANSLSIPSAQTIDTTGSLTIEPLGTSFTSALTYPLNNLSTTSTLGGLTLGKDGNTANITINGAQSVDGDVNIYGGDLAINAPLTASGSNQVSLDASGTVTDGASGYISADQLLVDAGGATTLDNANNAIGTFAFDGTSLTLVEKDGMTIGSVGSVDGITATGAVNVATLAGDLTISKNIATTDATASAVVLNAGRNTAAGTATGGDIVVTDSSTVTVGSGGTGTLYSGDVSDSTGLAGAVGSGSGRFRYNSDEAASNFTAALGTGVNAIFRESPTVAVTADDETVTYGTSPTLAFSTNGQNGDTSAQILSTDPTIAVGGSQSSSGNYIAGDHTLTPSGAVEQLGYTLSHTAGTLTVNKKALTYTGSASNKVYDGNTTAALTDTFTGTISGDTVAVAATGAFADKNVGTGKSVAATFGISGTDGDNYTIADPGSLTADITAKSITVSGITADNKVYDGTTSATVDHSAVTFGGIVSGDTLTASGTTGVFADKNAGTGKTVTLSGTTFGGADVGNYDITGQTSTTADITQKSVTVSGITAADKIYDGTTSATVDLSGVAFGGIVSGDTLTASGTTGVFADKNVGTGKTVTLSDTTFGGADVGNYDITAQASTTADITQKSITVSGLTAGNKVYDGTTSATVDHSGVTFGGIVSGDTLTASGTTGVFADKNVGIGKTVTLSGTTFGGADVGNYDITGQTSTTADITAKSVTVSGITAADKVYDGTTAATLDATGLTINGIISGDTVTASGTTGVFADKNAGTGKTVTLSGTTFGGADVGNYDITAQTSTTADITAKSVTVSGITAADKVYDGTTSAAVDHSGVSFGGIVSGDTLTASGTTGVFADKNVGSGKTVTLSGTTFGGADVGNYDITAQASVTADITQKSITVSGITAGDKVYDGATSATVDHSGVTFGGIVSGDTLTASSTTGVFADKNAGTGKTVTLSGTTFGGADVGNYDITGQTSTTADITAKSATVSGITAADKVYDATTSATLDATGLTINGIISGDTVTASGTTGAFVDKNAGTGKTVTLSGTTFGGADVGNYDITGQASTTADITPKTATLGDFTVTDKVYDGTTDASIISYGAIQGIISGDVVSASGAVAEFGDRHVGSDKTVSLSGIALGGADGGNYTVSSTATTTADITPKALTITGLAVADKVYDATTAASVTSNGSLDGVVGGDTVTIDSLSAAFADKNVGTDKSVATTSVTLGGTHSGNYTFGGPATTTADITAATLNVTGLTANDKVYDGTTSASVSGTAAVTPLGSDTVAVAGTPTSIFANKNVGTGIGVTISGLSLTGTDAFNYTIVQPSSSADITPAPLTITANNDAKFVTRTDAANFAGVQYDGFVLNEDASELTGTLSITRAGAGTDEAAGSYADALVASGLSATNYDITYEAGDFTIVPADELLIRFGNSTDTSTGANTFSLLSAEYLNSGNVVTVLGAPSVSGNTYTFDDGANGSAIVTVEATGATTSTGGFLNIGSYTLGTTNVTETHSNFNDNVTIVGSHTVTRSELTPTVSGATKVYDGTTSLAGQTLGTTGLGTGDVVNIAGVGSFASKNAGTGLGYSVDNLTISGADANNYFLGSTSTTASDGTITPKAVTLTAPAVTKVYDGNTSGTATAAQLSQLNAALGVAGDYVNSINLTFDDKNVGTGKTLTPSAATIVDGNGGNNYSVTYLGSNSSAITRLDSVMWIGGPTGDWSDPANWAGGAIPDLANVAEVIIPEGSTPTFDNSVAGPVQIDSLNGGNLQLDNGTLEVADDFSVTDFTQNGGGLDVGGDFTTTSSFTQSPGATLVVDGDADITHVSGDLTVHSLDADNATLHSTNGGIVLGDVETSGGLTAQADAGDITQTPTSELTIGGETTLSAGTGDITLDGSNNDFQGTVNVDANDVVLHDSEGDIELGDVETTGDLEVVADDGDVTQASDSTVVVAGETTLEAAGDIDLSEGTNQFTGPVNLDGTNVEITQSTGDITLGTVDATGDFWVDAPDGSIAQSPGSAATIGGNTTLFAGGSVSLPGNNNLGGSVTTNSQQFNVNSSTPYTTVLAGTALSSSQQTAAGSFTNDTFDRYAEGADDSQVQDDLPVGTPLWDQFEQLLPQAIDRWRLRYQRGVDGIEVIDDRTGRLLRRKKE